ncbi:YutD family protein [Virgibacillus natechei]|uniref:YutD family protein n=1 Tax=Virgibacillus sp. CBA3643 TaxID=2942278 RepID=UPI0035A38970
MIELHGKNYKIIENIKDGFEEEAFKERYSDILSKYDYIVGDWGYEQLRLKGFYNDHNKKAPPDIKIAALDDYLYEYCNFGCAYFVLKKVDK